MSDNIFEKLTDEEKDSLWMYMIFNRDIIVEKTEEWSKEAEKRGMTLTEYLESINPLDSNQKRENKMSLHITDKEVQKTGYKGCKNCQHQIAPLRMCKWAEQGGDGRIHFICPRWNKRESED